MTGDTTLTAGLASQIDAEMADPTGAAVLSVTVPIGDQAEPDVDPSRR